MHIAIVAIYKKKQMTYRTKLKKTPYTVKKNSVKHEYKLLPHPQYI